MNLYNFPLNIAWDITNRCNLNCNHCGATEYISDSFELEKEKIFCLIDNLICDRKYNITILGGEPLLRNDIIEIIDYANKKLRIENFQIATNGTFLSTYGVELLERNVTINVSFEGVTVESYNRIRPAENFNLIVNHIKLLNEKRKQNRYEGGININYTFCSTSDSPKQILKFAEYLGIDNLAIFFVKSFGNAKINKNIIPSPERIVEFTEEIIQLKNDYRFNTILTYLKPKFIKYLNSRFKLDLPYKYSGCKAVTAEFILNPSGSVYPCRGISPYHEIYDILAMNDMKLTEHHINSIILDKSFQKIIKIKSKGDIINFSPCISCEFLNTYCNPCWIDSFIPSNLSAPICSYIEILNKNAR